MHIIKKTFLFAHRGVEVEEFVASDEPVELTAECAEVAVAEGWAEPVKPAEPEQSADEAPAPQPEAKPTKTTKSK